jgi:hypothetical protein
VTMKNVVFWDVAPCRYFVNRRFGGTYRLHLQDIRNPRTMNQREQLLARNQTQAVQPVAILIELSRLFTSLHIQKNKEFLSEW